MRDGVKLEFVLPLFRYVGSQKLSGMLLQPYDLYKEGWADAYLMGMVNQVSAPAQLLCIYVRQNWIQPGN